MEAEAAGLRVVSLNIGLPREVEWRGKPVLTGIFKQAAQGPIALRARHFEGDGQADLEVHGGLEKAAYGYPSEHYPFWLGELELAELPWGAFGENLTTEGLFENEVRIGDRFRVGGAEVVVVQPRIPCFKLGIRFGRADMVKRFQRSGRSGFYFSVASEGSVAAGDTWELLQRDEGSLSVSQVLRAYYEGDAQLLEAALRLEGLPKQWRAELGARRRKRTP
jgi:MOSC domain-containing protein YiiM